MFIVIEHQISVSYQYFEAMFIPISMYLITLTPKGNIGESEGYCNWVCLSVCLYA